MLENMPNYRAGDGSKTEIPEKGGDLICCLMNQNGIRMITAVTGVE